MPGFECVLKQIFKPVTSSVEQGKKFERLMLEFFRLEPQYKQRFSKVWLWQDWPDRTGADTGIDLVAKEMHSEGFCAVQCKAYDPSHTLQKSDIDSFFTASGKRPFTSRVVVSTTNKWSKHAEEALKGQRTPVTRLDSSYLKQRDFDWPDLNSPKKLRYNERPKCLYPYQKEAVDAVIRGFRSANRGQLIMACGTGKTFVSLKIAESQAGCDGLVLFLVPSIALMSQSMREWSHDQNKTPHRYIAVCSDSKVGKSSEDAGLTELVYPPQTDSEKLREELQNLVPGKMTVVFCTYQSLQIVHIAQQQTDIKFDLVICDEAHRTTGVEVRPEEASLFTRVHDQVYLRAKKRLYMTATPRLYSESSKKRAKLENFILSSMDDSSIYGDEMYRLNFSEAIEKKLLSDYKVLIFLVNTDVVAEQMAKYLGCNEGMRLDDTAKLIGCWNALGKRTNHLQQGDFGEDSQPMRRVVAFANTIKDSKNIGGKFKKLIEKYCDTIRSTANTIKDSKNIGGKFTNLIENSAPSPHSHQAEDLSCEIKHVDGTMSALIRNQTLDWLREANDQPSECRVVINVRCLSEGVDVPALDAVIFTQPRSSAVDIVQSVGRVMRKAKGKRYGYVILPVAMQAGDDPVKTLNNTRNYRVVWQVLQALRSHDDRFNAIINKIDLNKQPPDQIQVIGIGFGSGEGSDGDMSQDVPPTSPRQQKLPYSGGGIEQWREAIFACVVQKCGDRYYWEEWVSDVATITQSSRVRINALVKRCTPEYREIFEEFLDELHQNLNPQISEDDAIDMLSQHMVTRPVFDALFEGYKFSKRNSVSCSMNTMLDLLDEQQLKRETQGLEKFYASVRKRASGIDNHEGKQRILLELYEKFFAKAFPRDRDRLGIVFTPVQIVDFILHSAEFLLRRHFGEGLSSHGVNILEPFVGTGTFMARLIQSQLLKCADLKRKYRSELHANELVLLSYYIAAVNIEEAYHQRTKSDYQPFEGLVLTDTFHISEGDATMSQQIFPENSKQVQRQKDTQIRVIIGNPPYSAHQRSQNDANKNLKYTRLDARIKATYAHRSGSIYKGSLYDTYIRALRWATDRIGERGLIAFVTNASFLDSHSADGLRLCMAEEFSHLYIYNLRGNQRTSGETSRREGGKIFGSSSRLPVAITLLVKDPHHQGPAKIHYHDIGDYLNRKQKLAAITKAKHIGSLKWQSIHPNPEGDWIGKRHADFANFLPLGCKENKGKDIADLEPSVFGMFSLGVVTSRDAWAYNHSQDAVADNMARTLEFYNQQIFVTGSDLQKINRDPTNVSWSHLLEKHLTRGDRIDFDRQAIRPAMYRPFCKQYLYFDRRWNESVYLQPQIFPYQDSDNKAICVSGTGSKGDFSTLMVDVVPDYHLLDSSCQCFPRYYYQPRALRHDGRLALVVEKPISKPPNVRQDNIPAATVHGFQEHYSDKTITQDAIFYYVYGVLHAEDYRQRYANDLCKMLPRIPKVPKATDFWVFSQAGRQLADLHLNYDSVSEYPLQERRTPPSSRQPQLQENAPRHEGKLRHIADTESPNYQHRLGVNERITKMRFAKMRSVPDRSTIICNHNLTLIGIPKEAYDYQVNGKSAIEWIIDRYQHRTHKSSGIVNDPNLADASIPSLLKRMVTVSLESVKIIRNLPNSLKISV